MKDRQQHLTAVQSIDQGLLGLRDELDNILGSKVTAKVTVAPKTSRTIKAVRVPRSRGRHGGMSGTQKIEAILEKASSKRMTSSDLARVAEKQGVANPHSSYQSLKRRNRIKMNDGFITLV